MTVPSDLTDIEKQYEIDIREWANGMKRSILISSIIGALGNVSKSLIYFINL